MILQLLRSLDQLPYLELGIDEKYVLNKSIVKNHQLKKIDISPLN